ncbi:MAG: Na+/H+ antiporter subunit G [Burkholderiales bacterium]|jgi:multicomponent K+:H+ antiporter subunit G
MMPIWLDIALAILVMLGALFALVGSFGLAKLSEFYKRIHGPTKASTLGVGCTLIASILFFSTASRNLSIHELLITLFIFITAPVSAHMLMRAAINRGDGIRPPVPPESATDAPRG